MKQQRISNRDEIFLKHYLGESNRNATRAAEATGIPVPHVSGPRIAKRLRQVIEQRDLKAAEQARLTAERVIEELCKVALDTDNPAQRVRALEVLAKIHGMTNDKVNITVDRKLVSADLDKALERLATLDVSAPDSSLAAKSSGVKALPLPS